MPRRQPPSASRCTPIRRKHQSVLGNPVESNSLLFWRADPGVAMRRVNDDDQSLPGLCDA